MDVIFMHFYRSNNIRTQIVRCSRALLVNRVSLRLQKQNVNTTAQQYDKDQSKPYKFTTSPANTPVMMRRDRNEYEPIIVASSLAVFLIYFLYWREENDLDELMFKSVPQLDIAGKKN
ncbi:protein ccsmst1 isoform X2 [Biomphalaria glabrata]|nr:protein ccsmst1 isoform X2 [Biomphalaria glabrata]